MPDGLRKPDVATVAVTRADGGVTVLRVVVTEYAPDGKGGRVVNWHKEPTSERIAAVIAKYDWQGDFAPVSWRIVPNDFVDEQVVTDRTFRNAWRDDSKGTPGTDMGKARGIHRQNLRHARAPLLETLDNEYLRADEANDQQTKKRVAQKKQALRDLTADPAIDAATTPDELKVAGLATLRR